MENYSLYRKRLELVKNKSFTFRIPIAVNPFETELIIETNNVNFNPEIVIEFTLRKTTENSQGKNVKIPVTLRSETTNVFLKKTVSLDNGNYLIFDCISNVNLAAELSIKNV